MLKKVGFSTSPYHGTNIEKKEPGISFPEPTKIEIVAKKVIANDTFTASLTQVLFTGHLDLADPTSLKQLMMIPKHDREDFLNNLANQIPMVREAARTNPGLLRAPGLPQAILNDYNTISQALAKDPTIVLIAGDTHKNNSEQYSHLIRNAVASLILGNHSQKIIDKGQAVHEEAQKLFPEPGIGIEDLERKIMSFLEIVREYKDGFGIQTRDQYQIALTSLQDSCNKISYKTFVTALKDATINKPDLRTLTTSVASLALTPISSKQFLPTLGYGFSIYFHPHDRDLIRAGTKENPEYIMLADTSIKNDLEFKTIYYQFLQAIALGGTIINHTYPGNLEIIQHSNFPKELLQDTNFIEQAIAQDPSLLHIFSSTVSQIPNQCFVNAVPSRINKIFIASKMSIKNNEFMILRENEDEVTLKQLKHEVISSFGIKQNNSLVTQLFNQKNSLNHPRLLFKLGDNLRLTLDKEILERIVLKNTLLMTPRSTRYSSLHGPQPISIKDASLPIIMGQGEYRKFIDAFPTLLTTLRQKIGKDTLALIEQNCIIEDKEALALFTEYLIQLLPEYHLERIHIKYGSNESDQQANATKELEHYTSQAFAKAYLEGCAKHKLL